MKRFFDRLGHVLMHYAWGAYAKGWNGAMAAVYGYVALAVGSAADPDNITAPSLHTCAFLFGVRFAIDVVGYFKDHPLPETLDTPPPFNVPKQVNPPAA